MIYINNTFTNHASASGGANAQFFNNLILDPIPGNAVLSVGTYTNYTRLDYNGYAPTTGTGDAPLPPQFVYTSPADPTVLADYSSESTGGTPLVTHNFGSLAEYQVATGQDKHSILVSWTDFVNAQAPNEVSDPERLHSWGTITAGVTNPVLIDLRLKVTSPAIDTGVFVPNVTDDFTGKAPDLGAYEYGQPMPIYGPRWVPRPGVDTP